MPRPLGAVCKKTGVTSTRVNHEAQKTDVTATLWTNGHRTRLNVAESDEGRKECGAENEAPRLRPEEHLKHSRSEQVVALMVDPKGPRRGCTALALPHWIGMMLRTFPEMTTAV